ncbi:hypothetical protein [Mesorhizobium sp.]|uniref:hypothetical protein n=1 Tax=Mesorhizobium sp. TaxID=1871066 RepID=UPI000FE3362F|nr:hypothetical protein [Mesorhizobium sp.]RWH69801.1 MAG: hypothetical protein EOQ84_21035 [Mesorhizobium sp.]RWL28502.1 MAG: hypothetical protein EOR58_13110 [Mesorhizobium sp.]RWL29760.1 MAG: hypothetical protein EOR63_18045 [Mesorhizobium sp.]RWL38250.1 MAG: hypothetical protein EOR59_14020 [Mesorhizobium sp.]RWL52319.1 MAG: hypothetical protein EOR61_19395 [Mesorhizobium sp.]
MPGNGRYSSQLRILTFLARHGTARYPAALQHLRVMFAGQMPQVAHDVVVIDNSLPEGHRADLDRGVELIGGSNSSWEFSAWDNGIAHVGNQVNDYDLVHLATSAFAEYTPGHLKLIDQDVVRHLPGLNAALGHVDFYNEPMTMFGIPSQAWLRSSFIFLQPRHLKALGSMVSVPSGAPIFSGDPLAPFREDAPISRSYRKFLVGWLTAAGTAQGPGWHSRFDLTLETLPFFESKARAILNEQMLTNRLLAIGATIVDVTWLARSAKAADSLSLGDIPDWRTQIRPRVGAEFWRLLDGPGRGGRP